MNNVLTKPNRPRTSLASLLSVAAHNSYFIIHNSLWLASLVFLFSVAAAQAGGYSNLSIAVYFRYQEVHSIPTSLDRFSNQWANVEKEVRVDKV
jgi:hypothetical protein